MNNNQIRQKLNQDNHIRGSLLAKIDPTQFIVAQRINRDEIDRLVYNVEMIFFSKIDDFPPGPKRKRMDRFHSKLIKIINKWGNDNNCPKEIIKMIISFTKINYNVQLRGGVNFFIEVSLGNNWNMGPNNQWHSYFVVQNDGNRQNDDEQELRMIENA